jgi:hypothetical protein
LEVTAISACSGSDVTQVLRSDWHPNRQWKTGSRLVFREAVLTLISYRSVVAQNERFCNKIADAHFFGFSRCEKVLHYWFAWRDTFMQR